MMPLGLFAQYFVDPIRGNDQNNGTITKPFRTLEKAQSVVRYHNKTMQKDIVINLRGGVYQFKSSFSFTEQDNGLNGFQVIYKAYQEEEPIFEAGHKVSGWQKLANGMWKATNINIPDFRQLYVNGIRANRARSAKKTVGVFWPTVSGSFVRYGDFAQYFPDGIKLSNEILQPDWGNEKDIELVWIGEESKCTWRSHRLFVNDLQADGADSTIVKIENYGYVMTGSTMSRPVPESPFYIENALELLDEPGEWYFDKSKKELYYLPRKDEDMKTAEVYIPAGVETMIDMKGSSLKNKVANIQFVGIIFRHSTWLKPNTTRWGACANQADKYVNGYRQRGVSINAIDWYKNYFDPKIDWTIDASGNAEGFKPDACIEMDAAENISILNCRFERLGAVGIDLMQGCNNINKEENFLRDLPETAIVIGRWDQDFIGSSEEVCKAVMIQNNFISKVGQEYYNSPGITAFFTDSMIIRHNELIDLPYSGISSGWGAWAGRTSWTNSNRLNIIEYNLIKNFGQKCSDGGGIYTIGIGKAAKDSINSAWSKIQFNYIMDIGYSYGALYPDEWSCFYELRHNVLENVETSSKGKWLHLWSTYHHDIKVDSNYSNSEKFINKGINTPVTNQQTYQVENRPQAAVEIIRKAGLQPAFEKLRYKTTIK